MIELRIGNHEDEIDQRFHEFLKMTKLFAARRSLDDPSGVATKFTMKVSDALFMQLLNIYELEFKVDRAIREINQENRVALIVLGNIAIDKSNPDVTLETYCRHIDKLLKAQVNFLHRLIADFKQIGWEFRCASMSWEHTEAVLKDDKLRENAHQHFNQEFMNLLQSISKIQEPAPLELKNCYQKYSPVIEMFDLQHFHIFMKNSLHGSQEYHNRFHQNLIEAQKTVVTVYEKIITWHERALWSMRFLAVDEVAQWERTREEFPLKFFKEKLLELRGNGVFVNKLHRQGEELFKDCYKIIGDHDNTARN